MAFKIGDKVVLLVDCPDLEGGVTPKGTIVKVVDTHPNELKLHARGGNATFWVEDKCVRADTKLKLDALTEGELLEEIRKREERMKVIKEDEEKI